MAESLIDRDAPVETASRYTNALALKACCLLVAIRVPRLGGAMAGGSAIDL